MNAQQMRVAEWTRMGEPSARKAEAGGRRRISAKAGGVESGGVAFEGGGAGPDAPGDVGDAVFETVFFVARGIAPVMLSDELFEAVRLRQGRVARGGAAEGAPGGGDAELVFGGDDRRGALDAMTHGKRDVVFAVNDAGDGGDGAAG